MGADISKISEGAGVSCCTQALTYDSANDSEDPNSSTLARAAQSLCHRRSRRTQNIVVSAETNTCNHEATTSSSSFSTSSSVSTSTSRESRRRKKTRRHRNRSSSAASRSESKFHQNTSTHLAVPNQLQTTSPQQGFSFRRRSKPRRNGNSHARQRSHSLSLLHSKSSPTYYSNNGTNTNGENRANYKHSSKPNSFKKKKKKKKKRDKKRHDESGRGPMNTMCRERSHSMEDANSYRRNVSQNDQQLLEAQYHSFHQQSASFMSKHAAYFPDSLDYTEKPSLTLVATNSLSSIHSATTSSGLHQNQGSMSPISSLSGKQMNIILAYSQCANGNGFALEPSGSCTEFPAIDGVQNSRMRACSVPFTNNTMDEVDRSQQEEDEMDDDDSENEEDQNVVNMNGKPCDCVANCGSIKRILMALKWYDEYLREKEEDEEDEDVQENVQLFLDRIMDEFGSNPYDNYLVKDYQHVLKYHLMHSFEISMGIEYALIQNELNKYVGSCDARTCQGLKRYTAANPDGNQGVYDQPECSGDEDSFFLDFMDFIHCFLMHMDS